LSDAFLIDAVRTPIGRKGGGLAGLRAEDLAAAPLRALVARAGVDPRLIDDVVMGCVTQVGEQGLNIARNAALIAGLPFDVTGTTVNRMCGSSQQALHFAAMGVASGHQDLVIAAGVESMSRVRMGADMVYDGGMVMPAESLAWRTTVVPQGISAGLVARRYGLSREDLDAYSLESHARAAAATDAGLFDAEIIPVGDVRADEGIRRDTTAARLAALKPAFEEGGVITAGNASQISDGAAAVLVASARAVKEYGLRPRARIVSMATAGVDPTIMLTGPVPASEKALARAGLRISDIGLVEINEAFASVALGCGRALGVAPQRLNVHGGAIALGHPLGASGARLTATLLSALEARDLRYGLLTMCIGFGQATATVLDREIYV
jgi:acetyl-CoA acetyltransferase family protein